MTSLFVVAALVVTGFVLTTAVIRLAARRLGTARPTTATVNVVPIRPTTARAAAAAAVIWGAGFLVGVAYLLPRSLTADGIGLGDAAAALGFEALVGGVAVKAAMRTTYPRAVVVWLVSLLPTVGLVAVNAAVVRPLVVQSYLVPSNPMAPTLAGWHREAECLRCGGPMVVPADPPADALAARRPVNPDPVGVCTRCLHAGPPRGPVAPAIYHPDHILTDKLVTPRRWDVVTFRHPTQPDDVYAMRLVGLPGEVVFVRDGAVWADGVRLDPPPTVADVRYAADPGGLGSPEEPWRLAADEVCVLGDFPARSSDSRAWGPVPRANLEGVVVLRYYPPARWGWVR